MVITTKQRGRPQVAQVVATAHTVSVMVIEYGGDGEPVGWAGRGERLVQLGQHHHPRAPDGRAATETELGDSLLCSSA